MGVGDRRWRWPRSVGALHHWTISAKSTSRPSVAPGWRFLTLYYKVSRTTKVKESAKETRRLCYAHVRAHARVCVRARVCMCCYNVCPLPPAMLYRIKRFK